MQSRKVSILESVCNVGSGFLLSLLVWEFIIEPVFSIEESHSTNVGIGIIFTVISVVRGYIWRRLFNRRS